MAVISFHLPLVDVFKLGPQYAGIWRVLHARGLANNYTVYIAYSQKL